MSDLILIILLFFKYSTLKKDYFLKKKTIIVVSSLTILVLECFEKTLSKNLKQHDSVSFILSEKTITAR